ncbi:MAG: AbrB family transcriptional regulator [Nitrosomonadales bacterium]|nr:MAG: AbrB family transcriptional regulator [Nitrosomonadales bacterium]
MISVNVRKQGGAAVVTVPAEVLRQLHIGVGSQLDLEVVGGVLTARPATKKRRYSLAELLQGVTQDNMDQLNAETAWAREGAPEGREIA